MNTHYAKSLFIFRRDLRIHDNIGFAQACTQSKTVIPCFILDPRQIESKNNFRSMNALQFMHQSLKDLEEQLHTIRGRLYIFYGKPEDIIKKLVRTENIQAVFCNRDYTPFSRARDETLQQVCTAHDIAFHQSADLLLHEPEDIKTSSGTPYTKFTPFFKKATQMPVQKPIRRLPAFTPYTHSLSHSQELSHLEKIIRKPNKNLLLHGGRIEGLSLLKKISSFKTYAKTRNIPALATTHLSAHLKFGTLSIREVYWTIKETLGASSPLLQQLHWRDFFTHLAHHFPYVFGNAFHKKYNHLPWNTSEKDFNRWCTGTTGFPMVDAGMRELNTTGYMHNRLRMIVASFLVKDLHINWQWGERYFAQHLIDYDPALNNGNWQWTASTGADAQPYFRIFNPWLQQKKFDPECIYIKKWVLELTALEPKIIHSWYLEKHASLKKYPRPMLNHGQESKRTKLLFKKIG